MYSSSSSWFSAFLGRFVRPMAPFTTISSFLLQLAVILFQPSNIILGLPLFCFPSNLPSITVLRRESPLIMWSSQFLCRLLVIPINDLFPSTILSISSLVLCSIQLILSILRHSHISKASNLLISYFLIVHVSDPYNTTLHIIDLIIRLFRFFFFSFPLHRPHSCDTLPI